MRAFKPSNCRLYYGGGECSIVGADVVGIEIEYQGNILAENTAGDDAVLMKQNNRRRPSMARINVIERKSGTQASIFT